MIYLFDNNENLIHILPRSKVINAVQTYEINKTISIECELVQNEYSLINQAEYIGHFYQNDFYMYKIIRNNIESVSTISGVHIVFDELKSNGYIRDIRPKNLTASVALGKILEGSRWEVGKVYSDKLGTSNWYDKSRLDALSDYLENWPVELGYRIDFDGRRIRGRYVDIYDSIGDDTGIRLVYGSNVLSVSAETSKANIYTALIGRGKGEEKTDEYGNTTGGFGRRIDFKDIVWSRTEGKPVDKPKGQEYVEIKEATEKFGFSNGSPRVKVEIFENCTDPTELLELTYKKLLEISRPQVTFKTTVEKIGNVNIGDFVNIIRRDLDLFYKARVFKIERNLVENGLSEITLGDYIATNAEKYRSEIKGKLDASDNAVNNIRSTVGEALSGINTRLEGVQKEATDKFNKVFSDLKNGLELQYYNDKAFNYELSDSN